VVDLLDLDLTAADFRRAARPGRRAAAVPTPGPDPK
jgi:hypothetical protein